MNYVKLGDIATMMNDGDWVESKDQDPAGSVRLLQLADIGDGVFRNRSHRFLNSATATRLRCTELQPGDILIARMPDPLGRACIYPGLSQRAVTVVDVCILRLDPKLADPGYVVAQINSPGIRAELAGAAQGATRSRVATGKLRELRVQLPSIEQQRRIAANLNAQLAAVAEARAAAAASCKGFADLPSMALAHVFDRQQADEQLSEILVDIQGGKSFQTSDRRALPDELGVLKVSAVSWTSFRPEEAKAVEDYVPQESHRVRRGDLLISRANTMELVGAVVLVARDFPFRVLSDKTLRLVVDESRADKGYLILALRTAVARQHLEHFATGASDSMRNISQPVIRSTPIWLPPLADQRRIAADLNAQLAAIAEARAAAEAQLCDLDALPARILAETFSNLE